MAVIRAEGIHTVDRILPEFVDRLIGFAAAALGDVSVVVATGAPSDAAVWTRGAMPLSSLVPRTLAARRSAVVEDASAVDPLGPAAYVIEPIEVAGEHVGGLCVASLESRMWSLADVARVRELAGVLAHWFSQRRVIESMMELSHVDELTKLYNRRGFLTAAERQVSLAGRSRKPIALFFVDLDGMKQINDELGHQEGDQALIDAASVLRATFRDSDVIARLGGDEFAVLAHDCSEPGCAAVRERLDAALHDFNTGGTRPYQLAMSVGSVTKNPDDTTTIPELIAESDKRMYREKRRTRRLSSQLVSSHVWATSPLVEKKREIA